jgi:hypothetical protein
LDAVATSTAHKNLTATITDPAALPAHLHAIRRKPLSSTASPLAIRFSQGSHVSPTSSIYSSRDFPKPETRFSRTCSIDSPTLYEHLGPGRRERDSDIEEEPFALLPAPLQTQPYVPRVSGNISSDVLAPFQLRPQSSFVCPRGWSMSQKYTLTPSPGQTTTTRSPRRRVGSHSATKHHQHHPCSTQNHDHRRLVTDGPPAVQRRRHPGTTLPSGATGHLRRRPRFGRRFRVSIQSRV